MDHDTTLRPRRRTVLGGIGAGALLAGVGSQVALPAFAADAGPGDFAGARDRWCAIITGAGADPGDDRVAAALSRLDADAAALRSALTGSADRVFTDLPLTDEAAMRTTYTRLFTLATAYRSQGSATFEDPAVAAEILAGLRTAHEVIYHPGHEETGNWWHWEIGASRALMDTCALLFDVLPAADLADYVATIDYFVPDPFYQFLDPARRKESTGANRIDLCRAVLVRGLVGEDAERVTRARDGLSDVFTYVTSGDGIYRDGSFIQHTYVPYTGSYGQVLMDGLSRLLVALAGSPWPVVDPDVQIIFDAVDRGFVPVIHDGRIMDAVRGRSISRAAEPDSYYGRLVIDAILRLADALEDTEAESALRWRAHCKGWLQRLSAVDPFHEASVARAAAYSRVLADDTVDAATEADGLTVFGSMDRAVHRSGGWGYAISMASTRIAYYECGNGENEQGFHTGDGMTYLYDGDGAQYSDEFWPTVDLYRLPGTTVDSAPLPDRAGGQWGAARPPSATWAGGATLGDVGAVGMHLQGLASTLEARKSWFCLDGLVLALGAGISGGGQDPVETIVENRNLHDGGARLVLDGRRAPDDLDWSEARRVRWAHLEGVGGYVFPRGEQLQLLREARTGSWSDINAGGPDQEITRRYLTMWIDHGVGPQGASYAYLLAPGAGERETRMLAARHRSRLRILENSATVQAVRDREAGVLAANFWGAGSTEAVALAPSADTYVNDGQHADTSYGSRTLILVKNVLTPDSGYSREGYLTFDLSSVMMEPDDLSRATLRLWARTNDAGGEAQEVVVYAVDEVVDEESLTWNTKPELGPELGRLQLDSTFDWRELELTEAVTARLAAGEPLTVALVQPDGESNGLSVEISSREHPSNGPVLRLEPQPESAEVAELATEDPCSVVLREDRNTLELAVADPTHNQSRVVVRLRAPRFRHWQAPENVQVTRERNTFVVTVDVAGTAGATHRLTFTR